MKQQDKAEQEAFVRGLMPFVLMETAFLLAGLMAAILTDRMFWVVLGALAGGIPLVIYVVRWSRKDAASKRGSGKIVE